MNSSEFDVVNTEEYKITKNEVTLNTETDFNIENNTEFKELIELNTKDDFKIEHNPETGSNSIFQDKTSLFESMINLNLQQSKSLISLTQKNDIEATQVEEYDQDKYKQQNETKEINFSSILNTTPNNNNINPEEPKKIEKNFDIEIPFIKKTKLLLNELKKLKEGGDIKEDEINNEITELPKRAILEMSLSDLKIKKKYESIKKELDKKNEYIKKLETEIVKQRLINSDLKKSENENLVKISALEDELRVMKLKFLGYNTSEEYNQHSHDKFQTDSNNCGHVYGERLVQSMWVRDNVTNKNLNNNEIENNGRPLLNRGDKWGTTPWISHSVGNMSRILRNHNMNRNMNNEYEQLKTENRYGENEEKYNFNNRRYLNYRFNNNYNDGNNFQRVSGMILGSPNKIKLSKNFNNEFNRFRIGNNNINNNF